jgi:iron complex transport system permease protein
MTPLKWFAMLMLLAGIFTLNLSIGSVKIPPLEILQILIGNGSEEPVWQNIIWNFRLPKALTCILAGSALSVSGLQMQTLFRNALAGPDVLGLTSGASLAVALVFMGYSLGISFFNPSNSWAVALAASAGAFAVFLIIVALSTRIKNNVSLLIVGLMIGAGTSSIVSVLQFISKAEDLQTYIIWTFGSLASLNWVEIQVLFVLLLLGSGIAFFSIKSLNAWLLGENYAQSLGIAITRSRILMIFSASILTGGVTAFCGPIAFVGLAVPHLVKIMFNTHNHKTLIPLVMIGGAALLLLCDVLTNIPGQSRILPINALTALVGAPVVISVILRNRFI